MRRQGSTLDIVQALYDKLQQVPDIVNAFERCDGTASAVWLDWLTQTSAQLKQFGFAESSAVAGIKADMLAKIAEKQNRKEKIAAMLATINPAQTIVLALYTPLNEKVENVHTFLTQVINQINEAGILHYDSSTDFSEFINTLYIRLKKNEQLSGSINNAVSNIGQVDVLRLLAEVTYPIL
ncbi:MAG: hypothetical protein IJQ89_04335 [Bacteroidales bacterium]|nr:hypothetical protein [Bacteroidales bacterium]